MLIAYGPCHMLHPDNMILPTCLAILNGRTLNSITNGSCISLQVVGSQARILYSDQKGRVAIALAFNKAIKDGKIKVSELSFVITSCPLLSVWSVFYF